MRTNDIARLMLLQVPALLNFIGLKALQRSNVQALRVKPLVLQFKSLK